MTISEDLFYLIRSMSQSEKRYFKVFASRHTIGDENDYVKLFDAIDRQKKYDEKALVIASGGSTIVNNFPVIKAYLYKMILKSMRVYRLDSNIENSISGLIQDATYLNEKLLHKQASKILERAKKQAYKYERFGDILRILKLERSLTNQLAFQGDFHIQFIKIEKEEQHVLALLKNISDYENCNHRLYSHIAKKGEIRSDADREQLKRAANLSLLKDANKALSYTAKKFFYHANALFYKALSDDKKSFEYQKEIILLFEKHPEQQEADANAYLSTLHNTLILCDDMDDNSDFVKHLEKLKNIKTSNKLLQTRVFESHYGIELSYYISRKKFAQALKILPSIKSGLLQFEGKLNKLQFIHINYNLACLYFYIEQFDQARHHLNIVLNEPKIIVRDNIHAFSRIINLMVHYELGNTELMPYLLKSTYRYLCKTEQLYKTEKFIIEYIKGVLKAVDKFDIKKQLKKLKQNIISINDPLEKQVLRYFDFVYWIDKKIK